MAAMGYPDYGGGPSTAHHHGRAARSPTWSTTPTARRMSRRRSPCARTAGRYTVNGTSPGPTIRHRRRHGRGDAGQRQRRRRRHPALARHRRAQRDGRRRRGDPGRGPAGRGVRLPVRGRPRRHVLVPLPPDLPRQVRGGCSAPRRRPVEPARRTPASARAGGRAAQVRQRSRRSTARRAPPPSTSARPAGPGARGQHRQRHHAGLGDRRGVQGARRRRHRPQRPEPGRRPRYDLPAGGRVDLGDHRPEGGARVDFAGTTALVLGQDPDGGAQTRPQGRRRPAGLRQPRRPGHRPRPADRHFDYRIGRRPGFLDGRPGGGGPSTGTSSPTCRCSWSPRATSWCSGSRTTAESPTRCTCTGTTPWCSPATARPPPGARGGSTPWRSGPGRARDRVRGRQPGAVDGPLPQPPARRAGPGQPPDVPGRRLVVPGRRGAGQPAGVSWAPHRGRSGDQDRDQHLVGGQRAVQADQAHLVGEVHAGEDRGSPAATRTSPSRGSTAAATDPNQPRSMACSRVSTSARSPRNAAQVAGTSSTAPLRAVEVPEPRLSAEQHQPVAEFGVLSTSTRLSGVSRPCRGRPPSPAGSRRQCLAQLLGLGIDHRELLQPLRRGHAVPVTGPVEVTVVEVGQRRAAAEPATAPAIRSPTRSAPT